MLTLLLLRWKSHSIQPLDQPLAANAAGLAGAPASTEPDAIRILAGYTRGDYIDRQGKPWTSDRYYSGGEISSQAHQSIARTTDNTMFEQWRRGEFSYDIPLKPGDYELHLFFVEPEFGPDALQGGGETSRMFDVLLSGNPLLSQFDILGDVGRSETADERVFTNVHPSSDGKLHLRFVREIDYPLVSAIELVPCLQGKMRPVRIIASDNTYTDRNGNIWLPDRFFEGGRLVTDKVSIKGSPDPDLYLSQRFGYFSYSIPVAAGSKYSATLHFTEAFSALAIGAGAAWTAACSMYIAMARCCSATLTSSKRLAGKIEPWRRPSMASFQMTRARYSSTSCQYGITPASMPLKFRPSRLAPSSAFLLSSGFFGQDLVVVAACARSLGERLAADVKILELAAYVHDISAECDPTTMPNHPALSADSATELWLERGHPKDRVSSVPRSTALHSEPLPVGSTSSEEICRSNVSFRQGCVRGRRLPRGQLH